MAVTDQETCADPYCLAETPPEGAEAAYGWSQVGDSWWCPLHAYTEQRRLQRQRDEIAWYDGSIRLREQAVADRETDRTQAIAFARARGLDRADPRVRRRLAEIDARAKRAGEDLDTLRQNRNAAIQRHELENTRQEFPLPDWQ